MPYLNEINFLIKLLAKSLKKENVTQDNVYRKNKHKHWQSLYILINIAENRQLVMDKKQLSYLQYKNSKYTWHVY